jgi:hypothetical protein
MNKMFVFIGVALASLTLDVYSQGQPPPSQSKTTSNPTTRVIQAASSKSKRPFKFDTAIVGGIKLPRLSYGEKMQYGLQGDNRWALIVYGDSQVPGFHELAEIMPALLRSYQGRLRFYAVDTSTAAGQEVCLNRFKRTRPAGQLIELYRVDTRAGSAKDLSALVWRDPLDESELEDLGKRSPLAVDQWRQGKLAKESIEAWIFKYARLQPGTPIIPELTEATLANLKNTDVPGLLLFYRSTFWEDMSLSPERRMALVTQQSKDLGALTELSVRFNETVRFYTVNLDGTFGNQLFKLVSPAAWQGRIMPVLYRGNPADFRLADGWPPLIFSMEGKSTLEQIEDYLERCLDVPHVELSAWSPPDPPTENNRPAEATAAVASANKFSGSPTNNETGVVLTSQTVAGSLGSKKGVNPDEKR